MVQAAAQTEMSTWSSAVMEINTDRCCYVVTDPSMALSVSTSRNFLMASGGRADYSHLAVPLHAPVSSPTLFTVL